MNKLGELFKFFKLIPRVFDPLIDEPRIALAAVREPERDIMRIVVRDCRMDRKELLRVFKVRKRQSLGKPRCPKERCGAKINLHKRRAPAHAAPDR